MLNRTMSITEAREAAKCVQLPHAASCDNTVVLTVSAPRTAYSSVLNGDEPGEGNGQGKLTSEAAWCSGKTKVGSYMQMDAGSVQTIVGVALRGKKDGDSWVTGFKVQVSDDGQKWQDGFCGQYFTANNDRNTKVKQMFPYPIDARFVRILPWSWKGSMCMRAGLIVCEKPCINGQLDYQFREEYASSTFGPSLDPMWGEGTFLSQQGPYQFSAGKGLKLDRSSCITGHAWTILVKASLDSTTGWQRIINSNGWGDNGVFVNDQYQLYPSSLNIQCAEHIVPNVMYIFGISRSNNGEIKLYLNGEVCAQGSPAINNKFDLDSKEVEFFHDDSEPQLAGKVSRIQLWKKQLSDEEIALLCNCRLPEAGEKCDKTITWTPPNEMITYSSVWNNDKPGEGHGRGRLNSKQGWSSQKSEARQFMVLDTGSIQSISGVITQGRHDVDEWVTSFKVLVSPDGVHWADVHCGRIFPGNSDRDSKVKTLFDYPARGRYVMIEPQTFFERMSMRAGVLLCERPCQGGELDYRFAMSFLSDTKGPSLVPRWGEGTFVGPEGPYGFPEGKGFRLEQSRCLVGKAYSLIMEVALDVTQGWVSLVSSEGWDDNGLYVNEYLQLFPRSSNVRCPELIRPDHMYKIGMTRSDTGAVSLFLHGAKCGAGEPLFSDKFELSSKWTDFLHDDGSENSAGTIKRLRLFDKELSETEMATFCGCTLPQFGSPCSKHIIVAPPDYSYSYSSVFDNDNIGVGHGRGRLRSPQAWSSRYNQVGQWMQIDGGQVQGIAGVMTQGRHDMDQWVTLFEVEVSEDGDKWIEVECGRIFDGNSDRDSKELAVFLKPVIARFVRIYPLDWKGHMSMRAAILLCERPCEGGELEFAFRDSLISSTKGPSLKAMWGEGTFDELRGYYFAEGMGLSVLQGSCLKDKSYTIYLKLQLDEVSGWHKLIGADAWGDAGFYVNEFFQSFPVASGVKCEERIRPGVTYQFVITRDSDSEVRAYLNGWLCEAGNPPYEDGYQLEESGTWFFHDASGKDASGYVRSIKMWDRALSSQAVLTECACAPPTAGTPCDHHVLLNPPDMQISYSSIYQGSELGAGNARGRLNSAYGWIPKDPKSNLEFMTIDTGEVRSVVGVVTQGCRTSSQWVTSLKIEVSEDGRKYFPVECGRTWDANEDSNSKATIVFSPVKGRFVRILPQTWKDKITLRAAVLVCERPCEDGELEYQFKGSLFSSTKGPGLVASWGDGTYVEDDDLEGYEFDEGEGLSVAVGRCIKSEAYTIYIKALLDETSGYRRILSSDGWGDNGIYVNSYFMTFPPAGGLKCKEDIRPGRWYQFVVSRTEDGTVSLYLNGFLCQSGKPPYADGYKLNPEDIAFFRDDASENTGGVLSKIKIWDRALDVKEVMEECRCYLPEQGPPCNAYILLNAMYDQIMYSSVKGSSAMGTGNARGRLNSAGSFLPATNSDTEWMQIDTGEVQSIPGVVIQGGSSSQWVTSFRVQVSDDERIWSQVECGRVFDGNQDDTGKKEVIFSTPVRARYVRLYPETFKSWPSFRFGVLLCERPCEGAELDFRFQGNLRSSTRGPTLETPWGLGTFDESKGYTFSKGQGLRLDEYNCINKTAYTIYLEVALDAVSGYARLIDSEGWGTSGLFVNSKVMTFPTGGNLECPESLDAKTFYQYVLSRSADGIVKLYLNGFLCASGIIPYAEGYKLSPHQISFFKDTGGQQSSGIVKRIRIWDRQLSDDEVATACACTLTSEGQSCDADNIVMYDAKDDQFKFSSVYQNSAPGASYAAGRLNSLGGWTPSEQKVGQYMQIDLQALRSVRGVVTQGSKIYTNWWTKSFKVKVSDNGNVWKQVECGRIFEGNKDASNPVVTLFSSSVLGRFLRIYPQTSNNGNFGLRAAVLICEEKCEGGELEYRFEGSFASDTLGPMLAPEGKPGKFALVDNFWQYQFKQGEGFSLDQGRCVSPSEWSIMLLMQVTSTEDKSLIFGSSAWGNNGLFVDTFLRMYPVTSELVCEEKIFADRWYFFGLTRSSEGVVSLYLNGYLCARKAGSSFDSFKLAEHDMTFFNSKAGDDCEGNIESLQMWKSTKSQTDMATTAGCALPEHSDKKCTRTILLNVPYSQHTYSDASHAPGESTWVQGQINAKYCWSPNKVTMGGSFPPYDGGIWMQLDSGKEQTIVGVATQGCQGYNKWLRFLSVKVSKDGASWFDVACGRIFQANVDSDSIKNILFPEPVIARYVKILPQDFNVHPDFRAGILLCQKDCDGGELDYQLNKAFTSSTNGPMLETPWGTGSFDSEKHWYKFDASTGLALDASSCLNADAWSLLMEAKVDTLSSLRQIFGTDAWRDDGLYVYNHYQVYPKSAGLVCSEWLRTDEFYQFGLTRSSDGTVSLFLRGFLCAQAKPDIHEGFKLDASHVFFFYNADKKYTTAGYLKRIRMWNKALTPEEMASVSQCRLIVPSDAECTGTIIANIPYSGHSYSSVWSNNEVGEGYGRGMLDSADGWLCKTGAAIGFENGCYMQLDSGKEQSIAGVVTQGRGADNWWTTAFGVKVSSDGEQWTKVACGMIFQGNTDRHTKVKNTFPSPIRTRFVRIYPLDSTGHPSMRAGLLLCEKSCQEGRLDYDFPQALISSTGGPMLETPWGQGKFAEVGAETVYQFTEGKGLQLAASQCIKGRAFTLIMNVMLSSVPALLQLMGSNTWENNGLYVDKKEFTLNLADIKLVCKEEIKSNEWYEYGLSRDDEGVMSIYLDGYLCSHATAMNQIGVLGSELVLFKSKANPQPSGYIDRLRLWNKALEPAEVAKECGCTLPAKGQDCSSYIIFNPGYDGHEYSSTNQDHDKGTYLVQGMLDSPSCWNPKTKTAGLDHGEWLQLDAGSEKTIAGVVTQGRADANWYMTEFAVRVSLDGKTWADVACGRVFPGNTDATSKLRTPFPETVRARYVRIYPLAGTFALRAGLLLCESKCQGGKLDYEFKMSLLSSTQGPMLDPKWGDGSYDTKDDSYKISAGKGLSLDEGACIGSEAWSTIIEAQVDSTNSWRQIFGCESWSADGAFVKSNYEWSPMIENLACDEVINANQYYQFGITEAAGEVSLYLNGYLCGSAKTTFKKGYQLDPHNVRFFQGTSSTTSPGGKIRRIRMWSKALNEEEMAKESGCSLATRSEKSCSSSVVFNINYDKQKFSSCLSNSPMGEGNARGMLDSAGGFAPASKNKGYQGGEWLQLDTGEVQTITGIMIQGCGNRNEFLKSFFVKISSDGSEWSEVECGRSFNANTDKSTKVPVYFRVPLQGRYVRIYPDDFSTYPSFRAGVLVS
eukprot:765213-Hanusia_phi.AAC.3